jgi:hypothetical protein
MMHKMPAKGIFGINPPHLPRKNKKQRLDELKKRKDKRFKKNFDFIIRIEEIFNNIGYLT